MGRPLGMGKLGKKMIEPVTIERWNEAQAAERATHTMNADQGIYHYSIAYKHNFRYCGILPGSVVTNIIEVGCADFPALRYVRPNNCYIVEPMASKHLEQYCADNNICLISVAFEKLVNNPMMGKMEIWMFNVLQHVQDPEAFIAVAKTARIVRYFEPIDTGTTPYHPHSFSQSDFERWFPEVNKYYDDKGNACFHDGPCCYGVYKNKSC